MKLNRAFVRNPGIGYYCPAILVAVTLGWGRGGGGRGEGRGRGNLRVILVRVCETVFRNLPHSAFIYLAFEKNGPIHILDHLK